ncbi:hypothetical protein [Clostridium hydrogenum]|uniref:hypothetical protein n=1 Tax=Clostridium hydrogenum TaxID=2855764 RepID=UPI001F3E455E|nr:hypothetical protein [Clostridium hydrogenum]
MIYIFCHSTPERAIREDLFKQGYFIGAFNTKIYKSRYDEQYGQSYSCKQPVIGPDFYSVTKENGLWYINHDGTGGG